MKWKPKMKTFQIIATRKKNIPNNLKLLIPMKVCIAIHVRVGEKEEISPFDLDVM